MTIKQQHDTESKHPPLEEPNGVLSFETTAESEASAVSAVDTGDTAAAPLVAAISNEDLLAILGLNSDDLAVATVALIEATNKMMRRPHQLDWLSIRTCFRAVDLLTSAGVDMENRIKWYEHKIAIASARIPSPLALDGMTMPEPIDAATPH